MKLAVILVIALAPCLSAQGRFKPAPDMLQGHFDAPQDAMPSVLEIAPVPVLVPAKVKCHGLHCKMDKLNRVVRWASPYMYASALLANNIYAWQHAADPFPKPKPKK